MDIGTEFIYEVTETISDRSEIKRHEERFVVERVDGDSIFFSVFRDGIFDRDVLGKISYGNGHIRNDHLFKQRGETLDTMFGRKDVDVMSSDRCGGSTVLYQSDFVYRWVQTQMWSGGVIFEQTHDLIHYDVR